MLDCSMSAAGSNSLGITVVCAIARRAGQMAGIKLRSEDVSGIQRIVSEQQSSAPSRKGFPMSELSAEVKEAMDVMIQDEYRSESLYQRVIEDFGDVRPFVNIVRAEARHSAAIAALYEAYDMEAPASLWSTQNVPSYGTLREACAAGVEKELENIALYDRYLQLSLPDDVRAVFEHNRFASANNHLRAFRRCAP